MSDTESLEAFYAHKFDKAPALPPNGTGGFNVFRLAVSRSGGTTHAPYARHDFYKIMVIRGKHRCHYADKSIEVDGRTLIFFNPSVPYKFERLDDESTGFFCLFKEAFYTQNLRNRILDMPMFAPGARPAYDLNEQQEQEVNALFEKMLNEVSSDYRFKYDLLSNHVTGLIHFAMRMQPGEKLYHHPDTNARITSIFIDLLESQFPIKSPEQCLWMRSAGDFATKLSMHVNHLNRAVRLTTGKTTTAHIAERIVAEATVLLKHTDWNISEISYTLGFAQPAHFTAFFKKQTSTTPTSIRFV